MDVAANLELARETIAITRVILELTNEEIRLLSKSSLLTFVARELAPIRERMIYGLNTGTLDDRLGASFERRTAPMSKRIQASRELQNEDFRTYAMICPSLPLSDDAAYGEFAEKSAARLRTNQSENVWAEVLNVRGE